MLRLSAVAGLLMALSANYVWAAPTANLDVRNSRQGSPVIIDVLSNDQGEGALEIADFSQPASAEVTRNPGGGLHVLPAPDFFGSLTFSYTLRDATGATATGTVNISVARTDSPVTVLTGAASGAELNAAQLVQMQSHAQAISQWLRPSAAGQQALAQWSLGAKGGAAGDSLLPVGGVFLSVHNREVDNTQADVKSDVQGATLGADINIGDRALLGAALGLSSAKVGYDGSTQQTLDETSVLVFSQYHYRRWLIEGQLGLSQSDIVKTGAGSFSTDGDTYYGLLKGEYRFAGDGWQIIPGISASWQNAQIAAFSQQLGARALNHSASENEVWRGIFSVYGDYAFNFSWGVLIPQLTLASDYQIDSNATGQSIGVNGEVFRVSRAEDKHYMSADIGIGFILTHGISGFINYHHLSQNTVYNLRGFSVGARWEF